MVNAEVNELLQNKGELLTVTYFKLQKIFEKKYGINTVVLMEIGTFFEVYEVNNEEEQIGKALLLVLILISSYLIPKALPIVLSSSLIVTKSCFFSNIFLFGFNPNIS